MPFAFPSARAFLFLCRPSVPCDLFASLRYPGEVSGHKKTAVAERINDRSPTPTLTRATGSERGPANLIGNYAFSSGGAVVAKCNLPLIIISQSSVFVNDFRDFSFRFFRLFALPLWYHLSDFLSSISFVLSIRYSTMVSRSAHRIGSSRSALTSLSA